MRALGLAVWLLSVSVVAQSAPVQDPQNTTQRPTLRMITPDTLGVAEDVLPALAESEPRIAAPAGATQIELFGLRVLISKTGEVKEAVVFAGTPRLRQAVVDGVKGWKYRPYLVNGEPREIQTMMWVEFRDGWGTRQPSGPPPPVVARAPAGSGAVQVASGIVAGLLETPVAPVYPPIAKAAHVQGIVVLHAVISKTGTVEDLRLVSGPPMLVSAAMDAVRQWTYRPYLLNGEPTEVQTTINVNFTFADAGTGSASPVLTTATPDTVPVPASVLQGLAVSEPGIASPDGAPEGSVVALRVVISKSGEVREAVAVFGLADLRKTAVDGVMGWRYRPFMLNGEPREIQSGISLEFRNGTAKRSAIQEMAGLGGVAGMSAMTGGVAGSITNAGQAVTPMPKGPIRISAGVAASQIIKRVDPEYPPVARTAGVQGVVILHAILSKTGEVEDLKVISGPPMLAGAALDAVRQWRYRPYLLNGVPCEVETTINVSFTLTTQLTPVGGDMSGK